MRRQLFTDDYTIYWPKEFEQVVEFLKERGNQEGEVFSNNMEVIVFAAAVGLKEGRKPKETDKKQRNEIALSTFLGRDEEKSLAEIIYLVALCDREDSNVDISFMRNPEGERRALEIFQSYAAGGLAVLNDLWLSARTRTPQRFVYETVELLAGRELQEGRAGDRNSESARDLHPGNTSVSDAEFDFPIG